MVSFEELDALVVDAGAPALGVSVHDEDSYYLCGGSPDGIAFRIVFGVSEFDAQGLGATARRVQSGGPEAFAAWTARYAPAPVDAATARKLRRRDVLELLVAAGLYPEPERAPAWASWAPPDWHAAGDRTWDEPLSGPREYAVLPEPAGDFVGPPGPWFLLVAHGDRGWSAALTFARLNQVYHFERFDSLEAAKRHFGSVYFGRKVGEWRAAPEELDRRETVTWLLGGAQ
jgi:hypothetical protein